MSILKRSELINIYNNRQSILLEDDAEKIFAENRLKKSFESFYEEDSYDIFLSHSFDDARVVKVIKEMLEDKGYKVYVDWIEDKHLDRGKVTAETALVLRNRMNRCNSLLYLTSIAADKSVWMPWELGYMDARSGKVAVAPILEDDEDFEGREYLGLYPYLDLTSDRFYIHNNIMEWVNFDNWMKGFKP